MTHACPETDTVSSAHALSLLRQVLPFYPVLDEDGADRQHCQQHRRRERALRVVLLVGGLHKQREGLRAANDVARNDGHRSELAHGSLHNNDISAYPWRNQPSDFNREVRAVAISRKYMLPINGCNSSSLQLCLSKAIP